MHFLLLSLLACPGIGGKDSGDTSAAGCGGAPEIDSFGTDGDCDLGLCTWYVDATDQMGTVTLQIDQTGDPAGDCGPSKGGLNACGEWSETHSAFNLAGSGNAPGNCSERKSIDLTVVDNFKKQQDNVSTLFGVAGASDPNPDELGEVTVLVIISDSNGNYADCAVSGDEPSFFASQCTNVLN